MRVCTLDFQKHFERQRQQRLGIFPTQSRFSLRFSPQADLTDVTLANDDAY